MLENLITDRTLQDFLRWKELRDKGYANMTEAERKEWASDMKGAYNPSDLNRVGTVLNYLRDKLKESGYLTNKLFTMRTDWKNTDIPTMAEFTAYIEAVETIRRGMSHKATTPPTPENTGSLDYQEANDIEQILIDIDSLINTMLKARLFMGEFFCGEI